MNAKTQIDSQPLVSLTENAANEVRRMLAKEEPHKRLRVYVEQGGCSGMQYGLVFDEPRDKDRRGKCHGVDALVDEFSANYLQGTVVDFSDGLNDSGFKITNPNAKQSCGCGKSFEV